jgi:hypothetical protein
MHGADSLMPSWLLSILTISLFRRTLARQSKTYSQKWSLIRISDMKFMQSDLIRLLCPAPNQCRLLVDTWDRPPWIMLGIVLTLPIPLPALF